MKREIARFPKVKTAKTVLDTSHHLVEILNQKISNMMKHALAGQIILMGILLEGKIMLLSLLCLCTNALIQLKKAVNWSMANKSCVCLHVLLSRISIKIRAMNMKSLPKSMLMLMSIISRRPLSYTELTTIHGFPASVQIVLLWTSRIQGGPIVATFPAQIITLLLQGKPCLFGCKLSSERAGKGRQKK